MTDVVVAAGGASWERQLLQELDGDPGFTVVRRCVDAADLLAVARTASAALAYVAVDLPGLDLAVVDELQRAGVRVVGVGDAARAESIGIGEVVAPQAATTIDVPASSPVTAPPASTGQVIAVWGTPGAPGTSTVALALAVAVARAGAKTVLIDADTHAGSLGQQLAVLDDVSGLMAACRAAVRGRTDEIESHLLDIEPGLRLLTGVPRADGWQHIRTVAVERVIERLSGECELIVVDCGSAATIDDSSPTAHLISTAAQVIVVGRCDPVGLSRLVRATQALREAVDVDHRIVLNQMRPSLGWREGEIRSTLGRLMGREPDVFLPWDQDALDRSLIGGQPPQDAAPKSPFVARIDALARQLSVVSH